MIIHNSAVSAAYHGRHIIGPEQQCVFVHITVMSGIKSPLSSHFYVAVLMITHMDHSFTFAEILFYHAVKRSVMFAFSVVTGDIQPRKAAVSVLL